jgi:hypothetical protein
MAMISPALIEHHRSSNREFISLNNPHFVDETLLSRSAWKLLLGIRPIFAEAAAGLVMTYSTALATKYLLDVFSGPAEDTVSRPVLDVGGQGAQFAVAQMLTQRMTSTMDAMSRLAGQARPTKADDFHRAFGEFMALKREVLLTMSPERRAVCNIVEGQIRDLKRNGKAGKDMGTNEFTRAVHLLETLELLIKSWENSRIVPRNIWGFDTGDIELARRFRDLTQDICSNVDSSGADAVRAFMEEHRQKTSNQGEFKMNVLVLAGEPGSGKSHLSARIAEALGCPSEEVLFDDMLKHMGGAEKSKVGSSEPVNPSPSLQFNTFKKLIYIPPGSIVRMEEANLVGTQAQPGGRRSFAAALQPVDPAYLDEIKRKWEPASDFGVFKVRGEPEGVYFEVDLSRVSFIITTNNVPSDKGIYRRFGIAYCNKIPEAKRHEIAIATATHGLETVSRSIERAADPDVAGALRQELTMVIRHIIEESRSDAGPQMMQIVILDVIRTAAQAHALGERTSTGLLPEGPRLEDPQTWTDPDLVSESVKLTINEKFRKHRGPDWVRNMLESSRQTLLGLDADTPLPDPAYYLELARMNKQLNRREVMQFTAQAVTQQWAPFVEKRPADIRNAVEKLSTSALIGLAYISETEVGGDYYPSGQAPPDTCIKLMDALMRIPSKPKNLSHWEKEGQVVRRREMQAIQRRICAGFDGGEDSGKAVGSFLQRTVDNTFPFPEGFQDKALRRATLLLSGPAETNPTEHAKRIFQDLGLQPIVLTMQDYAGLFNTSTKESRFSDFGENKQVSINLETMAGMLKPFFSGVGGCFSFGIVIDNADFSQGKDLEYAKRYLSTNAENPKLALAEVPGCGFEIPLIDISVIVTAAQPLREETLKMSMWQEHIEKISESERRSQVQDVVDAEVRKLELQDLPILERRAIRQTVDDMMWHCLQLNMAKCAGAEPLLKAVSGLFSALSVAARARSLDGQSADRPTANLDTADAMLAEGMTLSWTRKPAQELPYELVVLMEKELSMHAVARRDQARAEERGPLPSAPGIPPTTADEIASGRQGLITDWLKKPAQPPETPG